MAGEQNHLKSHAESTLDLSVLLVNSPLKFESLMKVTGKKSCFDNIHVARSVLSSTLDNIRIFENKTSEHTPQLMQSRNLWHHVPKLELKSPDYRGSLICA